MEHCDLLVELLKIKNTRFVGIYDSNLNKITDDYHAGIIPLLSREEYQNSVRYDIKRWDTYKMFEGQLGQTNYAVVKYERAILLTFALDNGEFLRVSIEPDVDYKIIIDEIEDLIIKNNFARRVI